MKYIISILFGLFLWPAAISVASPSVADVETAVKNNDVAALEKMTAEGLDVNMRDSHNRPLFYFALTSARVPQVLRFLADNGADLNTPIPPNGETPLIYAVTAADRIQAEAARVFIEELSPRDREKMADDFKKAAAKEMKYAVETVRLLIDLGADINQETPLGTPLMKAATNAWNSEVVAILLEAGADVNQEDQNGRTALFYAEAYGNSDISMQLIAAGADVYHTDVNGKTYIEAEKKDLQPEEIIHDM